MRDRFGNETQQLPGKGETRCNRTACQVEIGGAIPRMWNTSTRAWYCERCARRINAAADEFREERPCVPEQLPTTDDRGGRA